MKTEPTPVLDEHGYVMLVDTMPSGPGDGDSAIVDAARVSYQKGTKRKRSDGKLINYLMEHRHTSPFEMVELKFEVRAPIFVMRQWHRHRTASINEESARYSEVEGDYYVPNKARLCKQAASNRQGSATELVDDIDAVDLCFKTRLSGAEVAYNNVLLASGLTRELARIVLPQAMYSRMVWKLNLLNFFRFCSLRMDSHAQFEIREYATAMFNLARPLAPVAFESFENHWLYAKTFSARQRKELGI